MVHMIPTSIDSTTSTATEQYFARSSLVFTRRLKMSPSLRGLFVVCLVLIGSLELCYALTDSQIGEFYEGTSSLSIWDASHEYTDYTALQSSLDISDKSVTRRGTTTYYHYFVFNGVPDYQHVNETTWVDWTSNGGNQKKIVAQSYEKCIPKNPTKRDDYTCSQTDESDHQSGLVGITINGTPLWAWHTSSNADAVADETMDKCGGHPDPSGNYHYHGWNGDDFDVLDDHPGCFDDFDSSACPAPLIGVAMDGFPIYGPQICATDGTWEGLYGRANLTDGWREVDGTQQGDSDKTHAYEYRLHTDKYYHISCYLGEVAGVAKCTTAADKREDNALEQTLVEAKEQTNVENKIERAKEVADLEDKIERSFLEILLNKKTKNNE